MKTSEPFESVAADANVILSAAIAKAALRVFLHAPFSVVTTEYNIHEVREYLPSLAARYHVLEEVAESQLNLLPLKILAKSSYTSHLPDAQRRIGERDVNDIDLLAVALKLGIPVWSNDRDFQGTGVIVYSTRDLLDLIKA